MVISDPKWLHLWLTFLFFENGNSLQGPLISHVFLCVLTDVSVAIISYEHFSVTLSYLTVLFDICFRNTLSSGQLYQMLHVNFLSFNLFLILNHKTSLPVLSLSTYSALFACKLSMYSAISSHFSSGQIASININLSAL